MQLDHEAYPHLFDRIFDHFVATAERADMVALRATCKDVQTRIDRKLFEHVVVSLTHSGISIRTPAGGPGTVALISPGKSKAEAKRLLAAQELFRHARIVDVHEFIPTRYARLFQTQKPEVDVLRIFITGRGHEGWTYPAQKLVVFHDLTVPENIRHDWLQIPMTPEVRSLVINVTCDHRLDPRVRQHAGYDLLPLRDAVADVVVVIRRSGAAAPVFKSSPSDQHRVLHSILYFVAYNTTDSRTITIVGMEAVNWRWFGATRPTWSGSSLASYRFQIQTLADAHKMIALGLSASSCTPLGSRLKFMTLEEYLAEVGAEEFAINTAHGGQAVRSAQP
ncbi:hypothetical protein Q8F55_007416 [Vanrija albida]|uniref:F-box domain-containing protein n=1 Tax=Vanrija albida TaxID=181172 RepID=A0ABR3PTH6_9TREE